MFQANLKKNGNIFFTYILVVLWVWSGSLGLHLRSMPGKPGCTGNPLTSCGHRVVPVPDLPSPEDNTHSTSREHRIKYNTITTGAHFIIHKSERHSSICK